MSKVAIQRQYDDIIAENYDLDPQGVIGRTLDKALAHIRANCDLSGDLPPLRVLDIGMGTGLFLEKLQDASDRPIESFGLDISAGMVEVARSRIPGLDAVIDDAANLADHFGEQKFDVICTHFVTGFVPMEKLAPVILEKLAPGGIWTFVGGTSRAYPQLQKISDSRLLRMIFGGRKFSQEDLLTPVDCAAVIDCFQRHGYVDADAELFEPELQFKDFDDFMEFAYRGGWLTPFVEELGLQNAGGALRLMLNSFVFPVTDYHRIAICVARRPGDTS